MKKHTIRLILSIFVSCCFNSAQGEKKNMFIKTEFGELVSQILQYQYKTVDPTQVSFGQKKAIASANGWSLDTISKQSRPTAENTVVKIHEGGGTTCDTILFQWRLKTDNGHMLVSIYQTLYTIILHARLEDDFDIAGSNPDQIVNYVANAVINHSGDLKLVTQKQEGQYSIGIQNVVGGSGYKWWVIDREVGFSLVKYRPGQSFKPTLDLEPNKKWFKMYEQPRFK